MEVKFGGMPEGDTRRIYRDDGSYPHKRSGAEEKRRIGFCDGCKRTRLSSVAGLGYNNQSFVGPSTYPHSTRSCATCLIRRERGSYIKLPSAIADWLRR